MIHFSLSTVNFYHKSASTSTFIIIIIIVIEKYLYM